MADTYSIVSKFKARVDTTTGPLNTKTYVDSKPDRNLAGGHSAILSGDYDGTTSVSYTGTIEATAGPIVITNALPFRSSDLVQVGSHIAGDVSFIHFAVISGIGSATKLKIKIGGAAGTGMADLGIGDSITIPFNGVAIGSSAFCFADNYSLGVDELLVRVTMVGP